MTLWSGRFDAAPDPDAFDFGVSFGFDRALFEDDVTGSIAWTEALGAAGVLSGHDTRAIVDGLKAILDEGRRDPAFVTGPDEDVHSFVERKLIERIGDAGRRLHTGRSRNEQVSLDLRLYLRRRIPVLQADVAALVAALRGPGRARRRSRSCRPTRICAARSRCWSRTSFSSHVAALRRDHARLAAAARRGRRAAAGIGCRRRHELRGGHVRARPRARVLARRSQQHRRLVRSRLRGVVPVCAHRSTMVHLSRLAEDLIIFTRRGARVLRAVRCVRAPAAA